MTRSFSRRATSRPSAKWTAGRKNRISHRADAFRKLIGGLFCLRTGNTAASGSISTGRSARRNAPIATSTAMSRPQIDQDRVGGGPIWRRLTASARETDGRDSAIRVLWRRHAEPDGPRAGRTRSWTRVRQTWPVANDLEITLEANPTSVEAGRFAGYRDAGVNRISMGIQALNDTATCAPSVGCTRRTRRWRPLMWRARSLTGSVSI